MAVDCRIGQGDTLPVLSATLADVNGPVNLLGTTITVSMTSSDTLAVLFADRPCTLGSALGQAIYTWQAGDTTIPGFYVAQFRVQSGPGAWHFPNDRYLVVEVFPSLG